MASDKIMVHCRIRLMSEDDIMQLARLIVNCEDTTDFLNRFLDVQTTPFTDDVPSMTPEQLAGCLDALLVKKT